MQLIAEIYILKASIIHELEFNLRLQNLLFMKMNSQLIGHEFQLYVNLINFSDELVFSVPVSRFFEFVFRGWVKNINSTQKSFKSFSKHELRKVFWKIIYHFE